MDEEIKNLLKENLEISKESLKILKEFKREKQIAFIFKVIYWMIILILLVNLYNFLKPYIDKFQNLWQVIEKIQTGM